MQRCVEGEDSLTQQREQGVYSQLFDTPEQRVAEIPDPLLSLHPPLFMTIDIRHAETMSM
jgi:hypothetical protein